jgi:HK97 family phage portal protein
MAQRRRGFIAETAETLGGFLKSFGQSNTGRRVTIEGETYLLSGGRLQPMKSFSGLGQSGYGSKELRLDDHSLAIAAVSSVWTYRCIQAIVDAVYDAPYFIEVNGKRDPNHPFLDATRNSYHYLQMHIFPLWAFSLQVHGETYFEKVLTRYTRRASALRWLNPLAIEPQILNGTIQYFDYTGDDEFIRFRPDEIVFNKLFNPRDDLRGWSPLMTALDAVNVDRDLIRQLKSFLINDAVPAGLLTPKPGVVVDASAGQKFMDEWNKHFRGVGKKGSVGFIPGALDFQRIGSEPNGDSLNQEKSVRERICSAFGVPVSVAGAWDSPDYQTSPVTLQVFYNNKIASVLRHIEDAVNAGPLQFFDPYSDAVFRFDYEALAAKAEDKTQVNNMVISRWQAGLMTMNAARQRIGEQPIDGGDVLLINGQWVPVARLADIAAQPAPLLPQAEDAPAPDAPQLPAPQTGAPVAEDATKDGNPSLFIGVKLANNADLISLQNNLKQMVGGTPCEWSKPDEFHITLLYAPAVEDETAETFIQALKDEGVPDVSEWQLRVGSVNSFDSLGKYALHFQVRRSTELLDLQAKLYDLAQEYEIPTSSYSIPAQYKPHITMGYAQEKVRRTFKNRLAVSPIAIYVCRGDEEVWSSDKPDGEPEVVDEVDVKALRQAMQAELKAWLKFQKNRAGKSERPFIFNALDESIQRSITFKMQDGLSLEQVYAELSPAVAIELPTAIKTALWVDDFEVMPLGVKEYSQHLKSLEIDPDVIESAVAAHYADIIIGKALNTTREQFEKALVSLFLKARSEGIRKTVFISRMMVTLTRYARLAVVDGFKDGGREDFTLDDEADEDVIDAEKWLDDFIEEQEQYVRNIADKLYADETLSIEEIEQNKPEMWWNKSVMPSYNYGVSSASKNALGIFERGPTSDSCQDCIALDGIIVTMKKWLKHFGGTLVPCSATECKGFRCKCRIVPHRGKGKKFRGALPKLHGSGA